MEPIQSSDNSNGLDCNSDEVDIISQFPRAKSWVVQGVSQYQGHWLPTEALSNIIKLQKEFQAEDQDIIVASAPKSGTTWLKAIVFSIVNRSRYTPSDTPLLTSNPHKLVPFMEFMLYRDGKTAMDLSSIAAPRLFATHLPYASLPDSMKTSKCRIVYICRDFLDVVVSMWHFTNQDRHNRNWAWTLEDCVDSFCRGTNSFGPFWDHVTEFLKESLESPEKILFLKYEDMKKDPSTHVKKIAEFIGFPFSEDEERQGVVQQICELCSFKKLKDLQINGNITNDGDAVPGIANRNFFRKGEIGGWVNELSPSMVERLNKVIEEKLGDCGLTFKTSS